MPMTRPTLAELIVRKEADIESRLPGADARQPASNLNVLARVQAGGEHGLYGMAEFIARQIPFDTAEAEYLERWAGIWNVTRKPASLAVGMVSFTGTDGVPIPMGTELQRADETTYVTTAAAEIAGGTAMVAVAAVTPGAVGNLAAGVSLKMLGTVAGVNTVALVADPGLAGGADMEADPSLLARLLDRIRQPPHGGAAHDYIRWALEISGVTRAWVKPEWFGIGTIGLLFVCDDAPDTIPTAEKVAEVQAHIDMVKPVQAEVVVFAPTGNPINPTFTALTPDTDAVKANIVAELRALLRREAEPGASIPISRIRNAVSTALGESDYTMPSPSDNFTSAPHQIATIGVITWPEVPE